jgi:uncharacterized Tic20 family protein
MGMGILLPIVGWSEQRRKSRYASFQSLQALGYQSLGFTVWVLSFLLVMIVFVFFWVIVFGSVGESGGGVDMVVGIWMTLFMVLTFGFFGVYLLLPVVAAFACALGRDFRYPIMGQRLARYLGYDVLTDEWLNEEHEDRWVVAMGHFSVIITFWGMLSPLAAWIMQGKRSFFLKFQSVQALVWHLVALFLQLIAGGFYFLGFSVFLAATGFGEGAALDSSGGVVGLAALFVTMIIAVFIILLVPFWHIMGQWAGYRVLKGDDYHYPLFGKLIEKRLSKTVENEERSA